MTEFIFKLVPWQVRYLKIIEKSGYQALPWVRYITQNGGRSRVEPQLCPYVQILGKSWETQRNSVGTNLEQMQFYENGTHEAVWQRPARCEKVNFSFCALPDHHIEITEVAHAALLANVAANYQTSLSHFLRISFDRSGKHQPPPLDFPLRFPLFLRPFD